VLLVGEDAPLREAARAAGWKLLRQLDVRVLGQPAVITVWRKPGGPGTISTTGARSASEGEQ
jgi:hypothetical protein